MSDKQTINKISEDIICTAAAKAALEADGVIGFSDTLADNLTKMIAGRDSEHRGIRISRDKEEGFIIDIFIIAEYGCKIPQLAWDVQNAVKNQVSEIADKTISAVNIHVQGVALPKRNGRTDE